MNSKLYWRKRETEQKNKYITDEKEYAAELKKIYSDVLDNVQKEIDAFYGKYAKAEGITIAEAKKRVSELDIKQYERKAKRYVEEKNFSKEANAEMRLYNATMKINRLEMLKANIGLELISGHDELQKYMEGILKGRTEEELKRQAGILGKTIKNNAQAADAIVNASFHNAKFSDRVWMYQDLLKAELSKLLQSGLIQGKNPRVLAKEIRNKFDVSKSNAERLMRTELARVQTEAQKQSFERNGFTQYTFHALGDACDICRVLNGKHFKVKDMMPGENASPMHPNCRCSTSAYEDSEDYEAWLEHLSNGGTTEEWNKLKKKSEKGVTENNFFKFGTNKVDLKYIKSSDYRSKFKQLTKNTTVNNKIRDFVSATLTKYGGTDTESLLILDAETGNEIIRKVGKKDGLGVELTKDEIEYVRNYKGKKISIHNHPTNLYPTGSDFVSAGYRKYDFGIVATHDGKVYKYSVGDTPVRSQTIDAKIDKYTRKVYNKGKNENDIREAYKKALDELGKVYDISWEELL